MGGVHHLGLENFPVIGGGPGQVQGQGQGQGQEGGFRIFALEFRPIKDIYMWVNPMYIYRSGEVFPSPPQLLIFSSSMLP